MSYDYDPAHEKLVANLAKRILRFIISPDQQTNIKFMESLDKNKDDFPDELVSSAISKISYVRDKLSNFLNTISYLPEECFDDTVITKIQDLNSKISDFLVKRKTPPATHVEKLLGGGVHQAGSQGQAK